MNILLHLDERVTALLSLIPTGLFIHDTWPKLLLDKLEWHQHAYGVAALALILLALIQKIIKTRILMEENERKREEHEAHMDQFERLKKMPNAGKADTESS